MKVRLSFLFFVLMMHIIKEIVDKKTRIPVCCSIKIITEIIQIIYKGLYQQELTALLFSNPFRFFVSPSYKYYFYFNST